MRAFPTQESELGNDELDERDWGEPSDVKGSLGDSASAQAVTRVNVEQASKKAMRKPTRLDFGEGCYCWGSERKVHPVIPPG